MEPRDERPKEKAGKAYDPDRREVAVVRLKNGKTKRLYRQIAASPVRHIEVTPELNAKYVAMIEQIRVGKTKRAYQQQVPTEWRAEYSEHPYSESYAKYFAAQAKRDTFGRLHHEARKEIHVRPPEPKQATSSPSAAIVVFESRRSGAQGFHVSQQRDPSCSCERFASAGVAGGR
jgi:hypothetical protein